MQTVLLLLHLMIAAGLVGVVLLQRSEGGGLGIGGGGSSFMTGRGTANLLTRVTAGLAAAFFVTSISLTLIAKHSARAVSPLDVPASSSSQPAKGGVLDSLEKGKQRLPSIPKSN
ncbi:MAG: preprotein translocase subunit SecG [Hyphomicrobiaceae bacterium]